VAEYIKAKDKREQAKLEEAERIRVEKEREVARLRALQEKASDKQAELDALRAKRATEAYEREWRVKEHKVPPPPPSLPPSNTRTPFLRNGFAD
jgi:hypothetical protein